MDSKKENLNEATGPAEWRKRKLHDAIMERISLVGAYRLVYYGDSVHGGGPYVTWREDTIPNEELQVILKRGQHDEIMYLIERYNNAVSLKDRIDGNRQTYFSLPEDIQEMLALRDNQEEINAYLSVQGFGAKGQDVILNRGDHEEILNYVSKHGLLAEQQRKLLARENEEEIAMHISHHGLADEIIKEMIDDAYFDYDTWLFDMFIQHHELPVFAQKEMVKILPNEVTLSYISRYGLWNEAHVSLIQSKSKEVIIAYFERHHYLCPEAEDALACYPKPDVRNELVDAYMRNWKGGNCCFLPYDHFLSALLKEPEANRDAIAHVLLNMPYNNCFIREETEVDMELIKNGSDEALKARFNTGKLLHIRAFSELFFERDEKLFTDYVAKCPADSYYLC